MVLNCSAASAIDRALGYAIIPSVCIVPKPHAPTSLVTLSGCYYDKTTVIMYFADTTCDVKFPKGDFDFVRS